MITFMTDYQVNEDHTAEFERAYAATGAFGGMFVRYGCKGYMLLRHKREPQRYLVSHTWSDEASFRRAQEMAAQSFYEFQNRSRGWVKRIRNLDGPEMTAMQSHPDEEYEILSRS